MPRNCSVAPQKLKEIQREIKSLKEGHVKEILDAMRGIFCLIQVNQIVKHWLLKIVVVCLY